MGTVHKREQIHPNVAIGAAHQHRHVPLTDFGIDSIRATKVDPAHPTAKARVEFSQQKSSDPHRMASQRYHHKSTTWALSISVNKGITMLQVAQRISIGTCY
jgi:hypothetical protein